MASPNPSPTATPDPAPTPRPWWVWARISACGPPGDYRIDGSSPILLGDCAGLLLTTAPTIQLHVGQHLDVHLFADMGVTNLVNSDVTILRSLGTEDSGATGHFIAQSPGTVTLTASGYCLDSTLNGETNGPCPLLSVVVLLS